MIFIIITTIRMFFSVQNYYKISIYAKKLPKNLHNSKKSSTFAPDFGRRTKITYRKLTKSTRRDGRVVDCGGLENR